MALLAGTMMVQDQYVEVASRELLVEEKYQPHIRNLSNGDQQARSGTALVRQEERDNTHAIVYLTKWVV